MTSRAMAGWLERVRDGGYDLWRNLREQKLRSLLTLLSITWGTLAIILLLAFGFGFAAHMQRETDAIGKGLVIVWPSRTTMPYAGFGPGRRLRLTPSDVARLRHEVPDLGLLSAEFTGAETIRSGGNRYRVRVVGVEPEYGELRNLKPRAGGRFLTEGDLRERRRVVFLGNGLARSLFGDFEPVGMTVTLGRAPYRVIGVLRTKEQSSDYLGMDSEIAVVPLTTFAASFGRRYVDDFVYRPGDPARQEKVTRAVYRTLAERHGFDRRDRDALSVWDTTEDQRMVSFIFLGFNLVLAISGAFTLLVGGVGVANLMYILVRRRTSEIGLQMAVGARPSQVLAEVLGQAMVVVAAGGALGFLLAGLVLAVVRMTPATESIGEPRISAGLAAGAASLLALVGLAAGWFPARRAAAIDPVEALSR